MQKKRSDVSLIMLRLMWLYILFQLQRMSRGHGGLSEKQQYGNVYGGERGLNSWRVLSAGGLQGKQRSHHKCEDCIVSTLISQGHGKTAWIVIYGPLPPLMDFISCSDHHSFDSVAMECIWLLYLLINLCTVFLEVSRKPCFVIN